MFCRGWRAGAGGKRKTVLIVRSAAEHPSPVFLERLAHEYALKDELGGDWAVRPLDLERERGRSKLVLEDPGGEPLSRLLGAPMEVACFLRYAAGIAAALGKLHQRGLTHKDIKPANIVVNCPDGRVRLTGFGIATRLPRERQAPEPPETIAGTLAYMAPEQTGRMNRSIDSRSDLYSLGVTLYQMLTGLLPFTAAGPMEWVHCHIARKPRPPGERAPDVPAALSRIVMKLLAKTAEERYQTAAGVESDLRRCLAGWELHGRIDPFELGERDAPDQLRIPEKLYGRAHEIETLLGAFGRVVESGTAALVLVSGYSGIGKSAVVDELHKALVPPRGLFASGKFDQYKRGIPYSTLAQAFEMLIHPLLGKGEAELDGWRRALEEALGPNGQLIVDLVPELKLIVGEQSPVPALEPSQAKARFQLVFRRFIGVFARPEQPLALFLDDLQWLDAATLDLLEDVLTQQDVGHLLLIGAYRDNEVGAGHPLMQKLDAIRKAGAAVQEIALASLSLDHVTQLIADSLHCEPERAEPLARLVHGKTGGNPFFVIQFLSALAQEGLVAFDHGDGQWAWDLNRIQAKGYTDNVADLMAGKLDRLPLKTRNALQQLACLGHVAQTSTLALVLGIPVEQTHAFLQEAVQQELVQRLDGSYRFIHDRIHEAAYSLIPGADKKKAHLEIGKLLIEHAGESDWEEQLFVITNHLNIGAELLAAPDERRKVAQLNLRAGQKARASAAFPAAAKYFDAGVAMLGEESWGTDYSLALELHTLAAEASGLTGEFERADRLFSAVIGHARSPVDMAGAYTSKMMTLSAQGRLPEFIDCLLDILDRLGVHIERHPSWEDIHRSLAGVASAYAPEAIAALIDLPAAQDPLVKAIMRVLEMAQNTYSIRPDLFALFVLEGIRRSIEYGLTPEAARVFQNLALLLCGMPGGDVDKGFQFGMLAMALGEKYKIYAVGPSAMVTWAYKRDLRSSLQILEPLYSRLKEVGDFEFAGYAACMRLSNALFCAEELAGLEREMAVYYEDMKRIRAEVGCRWLSAYWQAAQNLLGRSTCPWVLDGQAYNREAMLRVIVETGNLAAQTTLHVNTLMLCYMFGRYDEALVASGLAEKCRSGMIAMPIEPVWYFYDSLTRLALASNASEPEKNQFLERVASNQAYLQLRAHHAPMNYLNKWLLVEAGRARVLGDGMAAAGHYGRAIAAACENGLVHEEALANEMAARFWANEGHPDYARLHIERAHECYTRWQAWAKTKALEEEFPHLQAARARPHPGTAPEALDLKTVVDASQAVSGEIELPKLIETLMTIALENAGADRGLLMLAHGAGFEVEVEAKASRTGIEVKLSRPATAETMYPAAVVNYAIRTQKSVILDDAAHPGAIFEDGYSRGGRARSVFCLPMLRQGKLAGVLYLENTQATHAFTPDRIAVLDVLAAQAAISLENARTYEALRESEAKNRCLIDSSIIGIFTFKLPHHGQEAADPYYGEVNDAFLRMLGYDREEFISRRIRRSDLTPPEWWERDRKTLAELRATGAIKPFEKEYFRKDGSRLPVLAGVAAFDEARTQGVAFVLDITERKRAEKELQALAEERAVLGTALNRSHEGAYLIDSSGGFLYVNDEACRALGYSREELLAMSVPDIAPDYPARRVAPNITRTRDEGPIALETDLRTKDGRLFPVEVTLSAFDYAGKEYHIALARDITARKQAEEEMSLLNFAMNNVREAAFLIDENARFRYVNDEACRRLQYTKEELLSLRVPDVDPAHSVERWPDNWRSLKEQRSRILEGRHKTKSGRIIPVEINSNYFKYGNVDYGLVLVRDITERKRAEAEYNQLQAEMARAQRISMMGQFAASIAHEISQPIAAARNNASAALRFLKRTPPDFEQVQEALACVVNDTDRAGHIIDRFRDQIKKAPPRSETFDINEAIKATLALVWTELVKNEVSVETLLAPELPPVRGDRIQLQQVLLNLIYNAVEAMIPVDESERALSIGTGQTEAGSVLVTVRNTGMGIGAENLEHVFEAFYTTKSSGVGIGLSLCRSIVKAHGGQLWAEENEPRGAQFRFSLPAEK